MVTSINSLPPEIILSILELASFKPLRQPQRNNRWFDHISQRSNNVLLASALVSKSWSSLAQAILLQSVDLAVTREKALSFYNAPLDQFNVQELVIGISKTTRYILEDILSKLNGLELLVIYFTPHSTTRRELDVSIFLNPILSALKHLRLFDTTIVNENNIDPITFPFNLQQLDVQNIKFKYPILKSIITPSLRKLSITHEQISSDEFFIEGLRLASPYLKELQLKSWDETDLESYLPVLSTCTSITHFRAILLSRKGQNPLLPPHSASESSSFSSAPNQLFFTLSAFAPNQLLFLSIKVTDFDLLQDILPILALPSLTRLQTLKFIASANFMVPFDIGAECYRRGINVIHEV